MIPVNQTIYKEMMELKLLKKYTVLEQHKDRYGNIKNVKVVCKNFKVANIHKKSKAKTYFVQQDVYEDYINTIG